MALEQVSPSKKGNQIARYPTRISADGTRVVFNSFAALDPNTPLFNGIEGDLFLGTRNDSAGWAVEGANLTYGNPQGFDQFSFSPDLTHWLQVVGVSDGSKYSNEFLREGVGHSYSVLSPPLNNLTGPGGPGFKGASEDQSHVYFSPEGSVSEGSYLPGDPRPEGRGADANLYVSHPGSGGLPTLELLARDGEGRIWGGNCGARLGGMEPTIETPEYNVLNGERNQGAVSTDGGRVYFSTRPGQPTIGACTETNKKRIMVRQETSTGPLISELFQSECTRVSPSCNTTDGDDAYQGASLDQTKVYFTTTRQLTNSDLDTGTECNIEVAKAGCDLYLYDSTKPAGHRLIQVSAGETNAHHTVGMEAKVYNSIAAISADGSRVYFVAQGVLTEHPNPEGAVAEVGKPNFYTWNAESGDISFIGVLSTGDGGFFGSGLWGSRGGTWSNGVYPVPIAGDDSKGHNVGGDGSAVLFDTKASLTTNDTDGGLRDIYRYNADTEELTCISCRPGGPDSEHFEVNSERGGGAPGTDYAAISRPISEDGETIEFTTSEGLLPGEHSGVENVYLWQGGQVYHLPGSARTNKAPANIPSLSADGSTLAYHTGAQLLPSDGDSGLDVYVARADGGSPEPQAEEPCVGEACQQHLPQPEGPDATSESFTGPGNVLFVQPLSVPAAKPKPKGLSKTQKLANALKECRKKAGKRRVTCERQAKNRYGARAKGKRQAVKTKTKKSSGKGSK